MGHGPYVKLVTGFLFTSLAFMVRIGIDLCTAYCLDSVRGLHFLVFAAVLVKA